MHVMEPPDLWQRYIDPAWRHAAPVGLTEMRRDMRVKVKSHVLLRIGPVRPMRGATSVAWSAAQDVDFAAAIARAYNDWLRDFAAEYPDRLFGAAMVAPHDVTSAAAEARRAVTEL